MNCKILVLLGCVFLSTAVFAEQLQDDWNDFLHYTVIGRFDLAAGFAQKIIDSNANPIELLRLSEENPRGYAIVVKVHANNPQLAPLAEKILGIIEQGRFARRTDSEIIVEEVKRLSSTVRGKYTAIERLRNAGEYAIPYMVAAMADQSRKAEFPNITTALPEVGKSAIRPLAAALAMDNLIVKAEIIKAMGKIGYPESLGYLKYVAEKDSSEQLRQLALESIGQIDSSASAKTAAELFFQTAESYYYKADSLMPASDANFANIWFWSKESNGLIKEEISRAYFSEMMTMRCCELSLQANPDFSEAISLWLAAFFRAEGVSNVYPKYFGIGHANAMTYATTAGAEYLHSSLARAVKDKDAVIALGVVEALARNAGEKSLMYRLKTSQPLIDALTFDDRAVRLSAAIAISLAGPAEQFKESPLVVNNLAEAISATADEKWPKDTADTYAIRACDAMLKLAHTRNQVIDLSAALSQLVSATKDSRNEIKIFAAQILAYLSSPDAQRAIADMAITDSNEMDVRIAAFDSLAVSAKVNANLLRDEQINQIYMIVQSTTVDTELRSSAAAAFGALNLPSRKVKDLILYQAKTSL